MTIAAINDLFIGITYLLYTFQYGSTRNMFHGTVKANKGNFVTKGWPSPFSRREILPVSDRAMLVPSMSWHLLVSLPPRRRQGHWKNGAKSVIISAPSVDAPVSVMGVNHEQL